LCVAEFARIQQACSREELNSCEFSYGNWRWTSETNI
jgi:hypothetical protein